MHTDVCVLIFGQTDGIIFKQGVRRELCGIAYIIRIQLIYPFVNIIINLGR